MKEIVLKRLDAITHAGHEYLEEVVWEVLQDNDKIIEILTEEVDKWLVAQEFYIDHPEAAKARRNSNREIPYGYDLKGVKYA